MNTMIDFNHSNDIITTINVLNTLIVVIIKPRNTSIYAHRTNPGPRRDPLCSQG